MDPQACLVEILQNFSPAGTEKDREDTIEKLRALADWLEKGGFFPEAHIATPTGYWVP
jgi:hypothetical protein